MVGSSKSIRLSYAPDGYSASARRLPDVPTAKLLLKRTDRRLQARGPAIVDTGFDGGVYPSLEAVKVLEGMRPRSVEPLFHPLYGRIDAEIFELEAYLLNESKQEIPLGPVSVFTPTEPEYLNDESLIGREILNKYRIVLDGPASTLELFTERD
jgi:hypothetical protein